MLVEMRHPGAFKIAHRPRPIRNGTPNKAVDERAFTDLGSGSVPFRIDDPTARPELDACLGPFLASDARSQRIIESLRSEIVEAGGDQNLRIRLVFREPREIFRLELELPSLGYQRTTLLDRETLEQLLDTDEVRAVVRTAELGL
jgi:hypothetical protein